MRRKHGLWLILLSAFAFAGCDPARLLAVKAPKKSGASVTVYFREGIGFVSPANPDGVKTIRVPSAEEPQRYKQVFYLGFGNWPADAVTSFARNIDSIVFANGEGSSRVLKNGDELEHHLLKHRSGLLRTTLTIREK